MSAPAMELSALALDDVGMLIDAEEPECISIYMPTHRRGAERPQDAIRFRKLLVSVREQLGARGVRRNEIEARLDPAERLLDDPDFWIHQQNGLAVFLGSALAFYRRLPYEVPEEAQVADHFVVRHLVPLFTDDTRFFLMVVSQTNMRLFEGAREGLGEIAIPGAETDFEEMMRFIDAEKSLQHHTGTSPVAPGHRRNAMYHGVGGPDSDTKIRLFEFFRRLDRPLGEVLRDEHAPLVIAGDERVVTIFRQANTYPHLGETIPGSADRETLEGLHERAWSVIWPAVTRRREEALARYRAAAGSGLASASVDVITSAARTGQVEVLFVARDAPASGTQGAHGGRTHADADDERDLVERAVIETIRRSGRVIVLDRDEMPDQSAVAAILRPGAVITP